MPTPDGGMEDGPLTDAELDSCLLASNTGQTVGGGTLRALVNELRAARSRAEGAERRVEEVAREGDARVATAYRLCNEQNERNAELSSRRAALLEECRARISGASGPKSLHANYTVGDYNFDKPLLDRIDAALKEV